MRTALQKGSLSFGSFPFPPVQVHVCWKSSWACMWTQSHTQFGGWIPCEMSKTSFQLYRATRVNLIFQGFALPCLAFPPFPSTPHKTRFNFKLPQHNSALCFWITLPDKLPHGDYVLFWLLNLLNKLFGKQTCPVTNNLLEPTDLKKKIKNKRERRKKGVACFPCVQFHLFFSLIHKQITFC